MIFIGILSTAKINHQSILIPVEKRTDCRVIAVASRSPHKATAYAKLHDIPTAYGAYQDLLDDPRIAAVYISTPNSLHEFWIQKALQAGKHVLCEKPAFTSSGMAESLKKFALSRNLFLMEAMHYRYHPALKDFFALLSERILGDIHCVKVTLRYYLPIEGDDIRLNPDLKGGVLKHLGCYCLDVLTTVIQKPLSFDNINVVKKTHSVDLETSGTLISSDGKTRAEFLCDFSGDVFESEIQVEGENGFMNLKSGMNPTTFDIEAPKDVWTLETNLPMKPCLSLGDGKTTYDFQLDAFIESLKNGRLAPVINERASELLVQGGHLVSLQI
ncbi:Gfo/Idh/MocA family protein [Candidatus Finniella inopinata]|uniref:Gfo/Idh/MocA family oxidoreductase n=1 Tax=Candidatus Finniella inopinata TaxID=1696036 RepID=A0A4Q7DJM5_9PROT|nr:Gfo/Idh/MocA family oxidoreductase [Candidatus Finniella inopinata]RZI47073.1 Gfo/Idh/MocA family oxidoreductase [Candidatus Finniella inopinata]